MAVSTLPGTLGPAESRAASAAAEFSVLVSACGVYELSNRAKLSLTGKDRVRWLNGMITNNIRDLATGQGVYNFLLTPQGKILGDLFAYNRGESLVLDTDVTQLPKVLETLKRYIIMDKVEIAEGSLAAIGIAGPRAADVVEAVAAQAKADSSCDEAALRNDKGFDVGKLAALQLTEMTWNGVAITVLRSDNPLVAVYELWTEPSRVEELKAALTQAGAKHVSTEAVELLRIAAGVPRYGQDIHDRDLPQETGQTRALNFTKGCYIGQEIVERIRARGNVHRMFTGFHVEGELPAEGSKVQAEGKDVGEITSVASLPVASGELNVALGYIRREAAGKELKAGASAVTVTGLPFQQALGS